MVEVGTLSEYIPASWFHPLGIHKVLKRFWHRLPDVAGSLFITLTIDPLDFSGPESAFKHSRKRIRKIFYALRKGVMWDGKVYKIKSPYAVKLEFHENGWPHFHIVFLTKRFLPPDLVAHLWGFGRTDVRRIITEEFHYLLKYVTKAQSLPDWILNKKRLRVFQPSRGFLLPETDKKQPKEPKEDEQKVPAKRKTTTLGQRIVNWSRMAKIVGPTGFVRIINFPAAFIDILDRLVVGIAREGRYLGDRKVIINKRKEMLPWLTTAQEICHSPGYSYSGS